MAKKKEVKGQFDYCPLCRLNHKKKRSHVYGKRHQEVVKNILKKLERKIITAKKSMKTPVVTPVERQEKKTWWCYFCSEENERNEVLGLFAVENSGLLRHVASEDHKQKMKQFWRLNRVDAKMEKFLLDKEKLDSFLAKASVAVREFESAEDQKRKTVAQHIQKCSLKRVQILRASMTGETSVVKKMKDERELAPSTVKVRQTDEAFGDGLSLVHVEDDGKSGNVHSGATPPWLKDDEDSEKKDAEIGASINLWEAHLKREAKAKLPPNRVGANFNRKGGPAGATWLPSFGKVWNKNRRAHSQQQFAITEGWASRNAVSVKAYERKNVEQKSAPETTSAADNNSSSSCHNSDKTPLSSECSDAYPSTSVTSESVATDEQNSASSTSSIMFQRISESLQSNQMLPRPAVPFNRDIQQPQIYHNDYGHDYYGHHNDWSSGATYQNNYHSNHEVYHGNHGNYSNDYHGISYGYLDNFGTAAQLSKQQNHPQSQNQRPSSYSTSYQADMASTASGAYSQNTQQNSVNSILEQLQKNRLSLSKSIMDKT